MAYLKTMRGKRSLLVLALAACGSSVGGGGPSVPDSGVESDASPVDAGGPSDTGAADRDAAAPDATPGKLQTVFLIMMENHSWSTMAASSSASYITGTLVPMGGHAENYTTPPGNHPSELNYLWLEAGSNLGVTNDDDPLANHQSTKEHLVTLLDAANISWKAYVEDISGSQCPLTDNGSFVTRHVPQLFFDDVTDNSSVSSSNCVTHIRPYGEFATDLEKGTVARYNFITPNLCNDMHGFSTNCGSQNFDQIGAGDKWLQAEVPKILASSAYKNNGVLFILWDEGDQALFGQASDGPIPLIVLSPKAMAGYTSRTKLTHSSMLRTLQEIFGVTPLLRDAANALDLSEFFTSFP